MSSEFDRRRDTGAPFSAVLADVPSAAKDWPINNLPVSFSDIGALESWSIGMLECWNGGMSRASPSRHSNIPTSRFYAVRSREVILRLPLTSNYHKSLISFPTEKHTKTKSFG
jgi:hypothetical protein